MQHAPAEEVDEVILHLQEQIDVALEESGDASNEPDHIKRILSTMSQPESFATSTNKEPKGLQWGVVALLTAIVSWGFNLGAVPYFSLVGIVWFLLIAIAAVAATVSRKTVLGKLAIAILILEAVSFPVIHTIIMEPKETKQSTELSEPGEGQSSPDSKATSPESKRAKETKQSTELSEPAAEKNRTDLTKLQGKWTRQLNNERWVKEIVGDKETFTIFVDGEAVYGHTHTVKLSKRGSACIYATSAGQITIGERKGEAMKPFSFIYKLNDDSLIESLGFLDKANNLRDETEIVTWKRSTALSLAATEQVKQKLNNIIIPEINCGALPLTDCVNVLRRYAQKLDPEPDVNRKGVNIVIHSRPGEPDIGERKIKRLMQRNVSLGEALKHVCTATGVSYKVDGNIVVICDAPKN